ncbi:hypothetical protein G5714_000285 [Onychostoma macrolepis]|uniref:Ubiquitin-like protease family profile domain-containing protein n=1 Tax=Onychostoma macrolepis TaxID=369639 RepID=A0A7J6DHJ1_9TELE|nr:hypothetical protein G5714_000285 [Onychostoma macrolepis]
MTVTKKLTPRCLWRVEDYSEHVPLSVKRRVIYACQHGKNYMKTPTTDDLKVPLKEYRVKKGCVLEASRWTVGRMRINAIPKQVNGDDCGVFACKYADFLSQGKPLTFRQCDIPLFRKVMVWEIIHEKIL